MKRMNSFERSDSARFRTPGERLTPDLLRAREAYQGAYAQKIVPLLKERAAMEVDLELAVGQLEAVSRQVSKDSTIERLEAELRTLRGEPHSEPPNAAKRDLTADAKAAHTEAQQRIDAIDEQITRTEAELLTRFGLRQEG
jgi:uncharacterized small protein (DUF1192 family)